MVSLWDLLSLISVATVAGGALAGAQVAGGGIGRYALGMVLGLLLGGLSMTAIRRVGARVFRPLPPDGEATKTPARLPLTYLAAAVWVVCPSPMLSQWIAERIIRAVFP